MDELMYLKSLAIEVGKSEDPRLKEFLEWSDAIHAKIEIGSIQSVIDLNDHIAVSASELLMNANYIEDTGDSVIPHTVETIVNRNAPFSPMFFYRPDFEKRIIIVDVSVIDTKTGLKVHKPEWIFTPFTLKMRTQPSLDELSQITATNTLNDQT